MLYRIGNNNYVPGFVCQLGHFLPITAAELEDLTAMTDEDRARTSRKRSSREAVTTEQVELPPTEPLRRRHAAPVRESAFKKTAGPRARRRSALSDRNG